MGLAICQSAQAGELDVLRTIAAKDPRFTTANWGVSETLAAQGNRPMVRIAQNSAKELPPEPEPLIRVKQQVFDHYAAIPATTKAVYKEIEVEVSAAE